MLKYNDVDEDKRTYSGEKYSILNLFERWLADRKNKRVLQKEQKGLDIAGLQSRTGGDLRQLDQVGGGDTIGDLGGTADAHGGAGRHEVGRRHALDIGRGVSGGAPLLEDVVEQCSRCTTNVQSILVTCLPRSFT